jgi:hypoxanthine-DNA glycosylase
METNCFDPIVDERSTVLILGIMPTFVSVRYGQYYAQSGNMFWDIIYRVCLPDWEMGEVVSTDYDARVELLRSNRIALWDVLKFSTKEDRSGNNDVKQTCNDFYELFQKYPQIKTVFFNGTKAHQAFKVGVKEPLVVKKRKFISLPTTSPESRRNAFHVLNKWMQIRDYISD